MKPLRPLVACLLAALSAAPAYAADDTLRIAMTASDVPTTTGARITASKACVF